MRTWVWANAHGSWNDLVQTRLALLRLTGQGPTERRGQAEPLSVQSEAKNSC